MAPDFRAGKFDFGESRGALRGGRYRRVSCIRSRPDADHHCRLRIPEGIVGRPSHARHDSVLVRQPVGDRCAQTRRGFRSAFRSVAGGFRRLPRLFHRSTKRLGLSFVSCDGAYIGRRRHRGFRSRACGRKRTPRSFRRRRGNRLHHRHDLFLVLRNGRHAGADRSDSGLRTAAYHLEHFGWRTGWLWISADAPARRHRVGSHWRPNGCPPAR